jgi:hypothetical protein
MQKKQKLTLAKASGIEAGCPFCTAGATHGRPPTGERFWIISGVRAGKTGVAVEPPPDSPLAPYEFTAKMDGEPEYAPCRFMLCQELIEILPSPPVPSWAPPLCLEDAALLDSWVVAFCDNSFVDPKWEICWPRFFDLVAQAWTKRLPIKANEPDIEEVPICIR